MIIRMLVSISRSDGWSARIGQELDVDDLVAQELMTNEQAEPANVIRLGVPRANKAGGGGSSGFGETRPARKRDAAPKEGE